MAETGEELKSIFVSSSRELEPQWTENRNDSSGQYTVVWNIETGHQIIVLNGHDATVYSAVYSPDGQRIVTSRYDGTSKVWNAQTGQGLLTLIGHDDEVESAEYSPNGRRIVTASWDETTKVWDAQSGQPLISLIGHGGRAMSTN